LNAVIIEQINTVFGINTVPTTLALSINIQNPAGYAVALHVGVQTTTSFLPSLQTPSTENLHGFITEPEEQISFGNFGFWSWRLMTFSTSNTSAPVTLKAYNSVATLMPLVEQSTIIQFNTAQPGLITWNSKLGSGVESLKSCWIVIVSFIFTIMLF